MRGRIPPGAPTHTGRSGGRTLCPARFVSEGGKLSGRIVKEKRTTSQENRSQEGHLLSTEYKETVSNRMIFNLLTPNGFVSLA